VPILEVIGVVFKIATQLVEALWKKIQKLD
jgi:hypothetical protein